MKNIQEKIKKFVDSKLFVKTLYGIGILLAVMIVFRAGIAVGLHEASFGQDWNNHYNENFGRGPREMNSLSMMNPFPNANGAIGKIIKIELPTVIVEDKDGTEKVIVINDDTKIRNTQNDIKVADLKTDDFIVVIGSPNEQGQVEAKLIRVMPTPDFLNQPK